MKFTRSLLGHALVFALVAAHGMVLAQPHKLTGIARGKSSVTLNWEGGHGPYLVETSPNLLDWSDQGEPAAGTNRTLAAEGSAVFYRVRDLDAASQLGPFYGLIQTAQEEGGELMGRHRLKSRWWLYKPQGFLSNVPATFFRNLIVVYQSLDDGRVTTLTGRLESLGAVATPGNAYRMTLDWTRGTGGAERRFTLTLDFPYSVNTARTAEPKLSDPTYELKCVYGAAQPELDLFQMTIGPTTTDTISLLEIPSPEDPRSIWVIRDYTVSDRGANVKLTFREGDYLWQGEPVPILKTFVLHEWTAPTTASGGSLPAFTTDSYFSRTHLPGHHNFVEMVMIEPGLDPVLSETTRSALAVGNIRYVYTFKDIALGMSPDEILFIGFDNTIRRP